MNSLYLILIALCFSAGVITTVLKSDSPKTTKIFNKHKTMQCDENKARIESGDDDLEPLNIFTE